MKLSAVAKKLLLGRFLTRSGDQAWDFAVPLVLLKILPGELRVAALYYFLVRLLHVIFLPRLSSYIDKESRPKAAKVGIFLQLFGVLIGGISVFFLSAISSTEPQWGSIVPLCVFGALILGGILASLGSAFMDIAIANDLVPASVDQSELAPFNSRLRQVDLITEVSAPILAGVLLLMETSHFPLFGFLVIVLWNLVSFFPEYFLLNSIFRDRPDLLKEKITVGRSIQVKFLAKFTRGWRAFFKQPVALAVLAYAILWLSVLSPHGVLLTAFLKDAWHIPEWEIGVFRGMGAFFGVGATFLFPKVVKRFGLVIASQYFVWLQACCVILALSCFSVTGTIGQIGFLFFILCSRIGLYGFSLGEMQIRQIGIHENVRGEVNGFANALTSIATLGLYGAGTLLPATTDFPYLILLSVLSVLLAAGVFTFWRGRHDSDFITQND